MSSNRKEPRQLKELRSLMPWTWDSRSQQHPPGAASMRDFQDCFQFEWKTRKAAPQAVTSTPSLSARKRRKKVAGEDEHSPIKAEETPQADASKRVANPAPGPEDAVVHGGLLASKTPATVLDGKILDGTPACHPSDAVGVAPPTGASNLSTGLMLSPAMAGMLEKQAGGWSESPPVPTKLMRNASGDLSSSSPEPMCSTILKPAQPLNQDDDMGQPLAELAGRKPASNDDVPAEGAPVEMLVLPDGSAAGQPVAQDMDTNEAKPAEVPVADIPMAEPPAPEAPADAEMASLDSVPLTPTASPAAAAAMPPIPLVPANSGRRGNSGRQSTPTRPPSAHATAPAQQKPCPPLFCPAPAVKGTQPRPAKGNRKTAAAAAKRMSPQTAATQQHAARSQASAVRTPAMRSEEISSDDDSSPLPPGREAFLFASAVAVLGSHYPKKPQLRSAQQPDAGRPSSSGRRRAPDALGGSLAKAFWQLQRIDSAMERAM